MSDKMPYKYIILSAENNIATLTINRPESRNALNDEAMREFKDALHQVEKDAATRVLIITGVGTSFVAGFDMKDINEMTRDGFVEYVKLESEIFNLVECFEKPVIGAVNGYAIGNGFELALSCDIRIASEKAKFSYPETKFGWLAPVQRLSRIVGMGKVKEILYTGRFVDAPEAAKLGLVNKVVPPNDLMMEARAMAQQIAAVAPLAVKLTKQEVNSYIAQVEGEYAFNMDSCVKCFRSQDLMEGMAAFREKRAPRFQGK
ncbi:MAG: enoyl-CoA hydratase-related protein [Dehalococcoidales bacterium]|nr:enoyl-CoA hydratase-related protein [Dehalococcoidales bacterium]